MTSSWLNVRRILLVMTAAFLLLPTLFLLNSYRNTTNELLREYDLRTKSEVETRRSSITMRVDDLYRNVAILALEEELPRALREPSRETLDRANAELDTHKALLKADVAYLLDGRGTTIATSNRNALDSFLGKNYGSRPYFTEAISGKSNAYLALGVTSGRRGIFLAHPVVDGNGGPPRGVAVLKMSIDGIERSFPAEEGDLSLMTDPHGVIFFSSNSALLYTTLWRLEPEEIAALVRSQQFGKQPFAWSGMSRDGETRVRGPKGNVYWIHQADLAGLAGWHLIHLGQPHLLPIDVMASLLRLSGILFLGVFPGLGIIVLVLYRTASREIAHRLGSDELLRDEEARFRAVAQSAGSAIVSADDGGAIVFWNKAAEKVFGYREEEVLGKPVSLLVPESLRESHTAGMNRFLATGESALAGQTAELRGRRKNAEEFPLELSLATWQLRGRIHTTAILQDITPRKRLQAERETTIAQLATALDEQGKAQEVLAAQSRRLRLSAEIGEALTVGKALPDVLQRCAEHVVRDLDAAFARIWTLGSEESTLVLQASAGLYTRLDGAHSRKTVGKLKIGMIAKDQQPLLTNAVIGDPLFSDQDWVRREGMTAFAGVPLIFDGKTVGVMALFARQPLPPETLAALQGVADKIALFIARKGVEEALLKSERRFKDVSDNALEWIWETDADGRYTYSNDNVEKILGYTKEEILGTSFWDLFLPYEREELKKVSLAVFARREPFHDFVNRNLHKNGETIWLSTSGVPILDDSGALAGYRGADVDITERKRMVDRIKALFEYNRKLFDAAQVGIRVIDLVDLTESDRATDPCFRWHERIGARIVIADVNPSMTAILGFSREEMLGSSLFDSRFIDERNAELNLEQILRRKRGLSGSYEVTLKHKNGGSVPILINAVPTTVDAAAGKVRQSLAVLTDLTELKKAAAEREQLISQLQEAAANIKTLTGLLPICAGCKKIRDHQGRWSPVEVYVSAHTTAAFSHGMCPDCIKAYYPDVHLD